MKIKLLVTDDSAFMRTAVRMILKDHPDIEVVGEARDGQSAVQMAAALKPDVITMDVEMPGMDGVTATRIIMEQNPRPIIMLSSMTERGSDTTMRALAAGAVDFIPKKSSFVQLDIIQIGKDLLEKIRYWGDRHHQNKRQSRLTPPVVKQFKAAREIPEGFQPKLVLIAASTGGPAIIHKLLRDMGRLNCPVVIAQHMPLLFTEGFARHLSSSTGLEVVQASDGMTLNPGMVAVCPGGTDTILREPLPGRLITCLKLDEGAPIHPSADILFDSASRLPRKMVAIVMTGMGNDGTLGARSLAERGCPILAQEPEECTIDGMPASVIASGVVNEVLNVDGLARRLRRWVGTP